MKNGNKIAEKSEKKWGMVGMMVGNVCRVQGPGSRSKYGNLFKNNQKIAKKSEKIGGWWWRNVYRVQGPFPNMVIYQKIARYSPKNQKMI